MGVPTEQIVGPPPRVRPGGLPLTSNGNGRPMCAAARPKALSARRSQSSCVSLEGVFREPNGYFQVRLLRKLHSFPIAYILIALCTDNKN